jgi:hypothetical protein
MRDIELVLNRIHLNLTKFHLNIKFCILETFLYIPVALLVKFPAFSLYTFYFIFHLISSSRTDPVPRPIFSNAWAQSHRRLAPVFV